MYHKKQSNFWTLIYIAFFVSFIILVILFSERLIEEPSHELSDITIFFPLTLIFLCITFILAIIFLYGSLSNQTGILDKIRLIIYFLLVIVVSGLSWSLRGVWGHQTGTFVWGTLLFSVLMLENHKDHHILFIFFANIGLAIGAMLPFANYPFIPRLIHFATWGMLGTFFAALARYFLYRKSLNTIEPFREYHVKFSVIGFLGLGLGITMSSSLYIDEGWVPSWAGGYITGAFYGLFLSIYLYYNNKKDEPEYIIQILDEINKPNTAVGKLIKIIMYVMLFGYIPIAGFLNIGDYYFNELGMTEFPFLLLIIFCIIYLALISFISIKYINKLGSHSFKHTELLMLFLLTLCSSSISAILRHETGSLPDFLYLISTFEFELSIIWTTAFSTILILFYTLLRLEENKKKKF